MKIKTIQRFEVEYEVPSNELDVFKELIKDGSDVSDYEVNQVYLGETIVESTIFRSGVGTPFNG